MEAPWVSIASVDELAVAQMKKIKLNGKRLLLANAEGQHYVVDEMCSHEDYSLYLGCIKDRRIKCSLHGSFFDLETGAPTVEPACEPIRTYPVQVADGQVWVDPT